MGKNRNQRKRTRVHITSSREGDVCVSCSESVDGEAVECQWCAKWEHMKCANMSKPEYGILSNCTPQIVFFYSLCISKLLSVLDQSEVSSAARLGKKLDDKHRLMKVHFSSMQQKHRVLSVIHPSKGLYNTRPVTKRETTKQAFT